MRISRLQISNFRNFAKVDIALGENAVIVGENKIGKSNLLYALRLILDRMDQNEEITARYMNEDRFREVISQHLLKDVYGKIREEANATE